MKKNRLGASALEVSEVCLGTMTWGEQNTEAEGHAQIEWALAHGINFIDTAEMYPVPPQQKTQGSTEKVLGAWLGRNKAKRASLVIASKIAGPGRRDWIRNGENRVTKKTIPWALDDSLKRLQTDYIDLYQIHWPERYVPSFGPPATVQNGYSLVNRMFDGDPAEASRRCNVPLLAYSPLAMGLLTGKLRGKLYADSWPKEARLKKFPDFGERYKRPRVLEAAEQYHRLAEKHKLPLAALAFTMRRFFVASTIIGATSVKQLEELSRFFGLELSQEIQNEIDAINNVYPSPSAQ